GRFALRPIDAPPACLVELPVLGGEQVEQEPVVQPAVDEVALPLSAHEATVEPLQAAERGVAVHDPGIDAVETEAPEREGEEPRGREAHISALRKGLVPCDRPQGPGPRDTVHGVQADYPERDLAPFGRVRPHEMGLSLGHDLQQGRRDGLPPVAETQPPAILLAGEPACCKLEHRRRVERDEPDHVSNGHTADGCGAGHRSAAYAASSFGASWRHSSSFSIRLRPYAPIAARRAGSSRSSTILAAKSTGSFRRAYREPSRAEKRPSARSNCTIGLPSAMYSMILFIVDLSFSSFATSGFTQTSAVLSIASSCASGTRPVNVT